MTRLYKCAIYSISLVMGPQAFATTYNCTALSIPGEAGNVNGINNAGIMVGTYTVGSIQHGFIQNAAGGSVTTVDYPAPPGSTNTQLLTINNNGVAVGSFNNPQAHTFGYFIYDQAGNFNPITVPAPYILENAYGINDRGAISVFVGQGTSGPPTSLSFAIRNPDGSLSLVPGYGGQTQNLPGSVNNSLQMLETDHSFGQSALATPSGNVTQLSFQGLFTYAWGVNNNGTVVGYGLGMSREPPYNDFTFDSSGTYSEALCPGVSLFASGSSRGQPYYVGINDSGVLAGSAIATPLPGLAQLSLSTSNLVFPPTPVGQTSPPQSFTITNNGNARLDMASFAGIFYGNIQLSVFVASGCLDMRTLIASLDPGASCKVTVTATPNKQGQQTDAIALHDSAPGSPHLIALSVTGTAPPPSCQISGASAGQVSLTMQDTDTGLKSIVLLNSSNATVNIPSFISGTTSPVTVTASQVSAGPASTVSLQATNVAGAATTCGTTFFAGATSQWTGLGGSFTSKIALAANSDGRLQAFVRSTDNALWTIAQTTPDGPWSSWQSLGGGLVGDPTVAVNSDGRLEVFALGTDNSLWHIAQTSAGAGFSDWQGLGNTLTSDPAVAVNADGRLEVFAAGADHALWHIAQTSAGGGWADWSSLGGVILANPAVVTNTDGTVEAFVLGTDHTLWHIGQASPGGAAWSNWDGLGGSLNGDPVAVVGLNGTVNVFALSTDSSLQYIAHPKGGGWSAFLGLGGVLTSIPAAVVNADGRVEAFARGTDNSLWHLAQASPGNGAWAPWTTLGGALGDKLGAALNVDGRVDAFVEAVDSTLWYIGQSSAGAWN